MSLPRGRIVRGTPAKSSERVPGEARADVEARAAALFLALRAREEAAAERNLTLTVELAVLLAERLLGEALAADPSRIVALARRALVAARAGRVTVIDAHPLDSDALRTHLPLEEFAESVEIREDTSLSRGDLLIHTDLGTLHAELRPSLQRLSETLHDALRKP